MALSESRRSDIAPKRVLIADDNAVVRAVVRTLIETKLGLEVCGEAVDGLDVIQQAKDLKPDVVLLDFRMPILTGIEAAPIIKGAYPHVRIVLFTMYENEISKAMARGAYIDLVVSKPDGLNTLLESIQDLMEPGRQV
jgi:DNA-binding NarL/FixJ family response regulator